ncbi:uncharacterized protein B0I36DRAFT_104602 [Microdochium trichocladiopsis]|uniref:Uncharacterized protein n=1 Tax=Microdochium trichocladiopsis TaxID=1682393 RepID=A0A9P8YBH3_9PEZI|nr:uncharacterized protein B0I36DRAFT_104602 [Microdochium trichocladiopsis]KAH7033068.1 hypothetical protein B0I36DRAFT_104602 [Microdochium trichocladiopsis]
MAYINFRLGDSRPKAFAAFIETLPKSETGWETLAHSRCPSSTSTLILLSPLKGPDDPLKAHLKRVNALPSGSAVKSYAQFITFCIGYITLKERRLSNDEVDQVLQSVLGKDLSQDRLRKRRNGAKFLAHVIDSLLPRFRDLAPLLFFCATPAMPEPNWQP